MMMAKSLKKIYTKDFFIVLGIGFLPLIWKVLEIAFLAGFENSLKILGQLTLISIIFKVFEETLINPLYKSLSKGDFVSEEEQNHVAKKFFVYYAIAIVCFTAIVFLLNKFIIEASYVPSYIADEVFVFFRIYIIACGFGIASKFLYTFNLISKNTKKMFLYLLIKAIGTAVLLLALVPKFSFGLGVYGVAISELVVNVVALIYLCFCFPKTVKPTKNFDIKTYFKLMLFAFAETVIRNVVYYCVILVFLNILDNQDLYFVANEYIWSILLVPTLAQNTIIKQEISNDQTASLKPYFLNSCLLILFMFVLIPAAIFVFKIIYGLQNYMEYFYVLLKLFPCYIIFVFDSVIEAYFLSTGKLHHIFIQNLITNIGIYLTAFVLLLCGVWQISLDAVILLFNCGVVVSSIYTILVFAFEKRRENKKIK